MIENEETTIDKYLVRPARKRRPDMSASFVTSEGDKKVWSEYFAVWLIKEGYYKGEDKDGNTIIVQTRTARDVITGQQDTPSNKRRPDLFIHIETEEDGEKLWDEILVAWKSKNGNYLAQNEDGQDIVIQTRETKEALFKRFQQKQIAPVDLDIDHTPDESADELTEPQETTELSET